MENVENEEGTIEDEEIEKIRIRNLNVIQDFNNKKANAHATIFVASMFALFTFLALAQRIVKDNNSVLNPRIFYISIVSYCLIWGFGLYELSNFTYYSTVAQKAEEEIIGRFERAMVEKYMEGWKGPFNRFASYKTKPERRLRRNNEWMSLCVYIAVGFLPFYAFLIWVGLPHLLF